ncbi:MAG: hypothetical protein WC378_07030 [Opitutaceae bacterium]|jgi:hypothetical protein
MTETSKWQRLALCGVLLYMGILLARNMGAYAGGSDSSGYMNFARLLREGATTETQRCIEGLRPSDLPGYAYVPLGFVPQDEIRLVPTYPVGLPLLIAGTSRICGPALAPSLVIWFHGMAGLLLFYGLGRQAGMGRWWALAGLIILGVGSLYLSFSVQLMSDMPAMVWALAAVLAAWQARRSAWWSLAAGMAMAVAVLIRPSNLLLMIPIGVALGLDWRRWLGLVLGGLPGAVLLAAVNQSLYGKAYISGYGNFWILFSPSCVGPVLMHYIRWLPIVLTPLVVLAPLAPWLCRRELSSAQFLVLVLWPLSFLSFYAFYPFTSETWWYLRFVLPAFPPLLILSLLAARRLTRRFQREHLNWAAFLMLIVCVVWSYKWSHKLYAQGFGKEESMYPESCALLQATAPGNAVVLGCQTSGALLYYTRHIIGRLACMEDGSWERVVAASRSAGRPVYALLFPFELPELDKGKIPGHWVKVGAVRQVTLWRLDPP